MPSRLCVPTFERISNQTYRTGLREAQDVLGDCDSVSYLPLEPTKAFSFKEKFLMRAAFHDPMGLMMVANPGLKPVRVEENHNAFIFLCPYWRDLRFINAVSGWQKRCTTKVCWIDELWAKDIPEIRRWKKVLDHFDHIFVGIDGSSEKLSEALGRPCHFLPGAVDAFRFSAYPKLPQRSIDIYSVGRRVATVHDALIKTAVEHELFYVHDTIQNGNSAAPDHRSHRRMYANMAKRCRLFMVAPAKVDMPQHTDRQIDIGFRCFEGAAAGAVLVGHPPDSALFRRLFHWPEAVVPLEMDGSDTTSVVMNLLEDEPRMQRISRQNSEQMLRNHDWIHRWKTIFDIARLEPSSGMLARLKKLDQVASTFA